MGFFKKLVDPFNMKDKLFDQKETTFDPLSLFTDEQKKSVNALTSLASTGTGGGITLGEGFEGSLGNYDVTQGEQQAITGLQGLLSGGGDISAARDVFSRAANNEFNPDDPSSGFGAFSRALEKSGAKSQDALNQQAAISGGFFGSGRGRDSASLQADLSNQRGSFLANLYNQGQNRAITGAQGLTGIADQEQGLLTELSRQSSIERILKDRQAKDQYTEFNRSREEELKRLGLMKEQMRDPLGKFTTKSPSLFSQLAPALGAAAGALTGLPGGAQVGASFGSGLRGAFDDPASQRPNTSRYR